MDALALDLKHKLKNVEKIDSVYFGGGTPSVVDASYYRPIFALLAQHINTLCEITMEANPNSITREWLSQIKDLGVNRLSVGVQSFDDEKLTFLGRAHSAKTALDALELVKSFFDNYSIDLIYNTPFDNLSFLQKELVHIAKLGSTHVSAYALTIEDGTRFFDKGVDAKEDMEATKYLFDELRTLGYTQYEISNFGKPSIHNMGYWQLHDYIGVGAGAVGYQNGIRYSPHKEITNYIENPHYVSEEVIDEEALLSEKIMLGFRSFVGVSASILTPKMVQKASVLVEEKVLDFIEGRFYNRDYLVADEVALYLLI